MTEYPHDRGSGSPARSDEKTVGFERRGSEIVLSAEDAELAKLGYKQEFKREFSWISTFSFAFSISGLLATVVTTFGFPLTAGGPPSVVWCWLIGGASCMCIAMSVGELVSAYPTSGGLYFTVKYLAPKRHRAVVGWFTGWLNLLGQAAGTASTDFACAQMTLAAVSMSTDFDYAPTNDQTVAVFIGFILFHACLNTLNTAWLARITKYYAFFNIGCTFAAIIALSVGQPVKNDGRTIFVEVVNSTGWSNDGFAFLFGFLSVAWVMTDYDATAHIAEEIKNPAIKAPIAIISALGTTYVLGWFLNIVMCLCMGAWPDLLTSPTGLPAAQIFYNVLGKNGGITFMVLSTVICNFTGATALQAQSRTLFALARDEMLPFSKYMYKINPRTHTPIISVWINAFFCACLGLIDLASYTAISAIFNICAIALDWSYCIPILCKIIWPENFTPGPINFGRASRYINIWACSWTAFLSIIFLFPTIQPVTVLNMNYAVVVLAGVGLFAFIWWWAGARHYYIGPRTNTEIVIGEVGPDGTVHGVIQNAHGDIVGTVDNLDAGNLHGMYDHKIS